MKLRSLRVHGFKSFADRTTIEFREGVTAIIGSNGCGKSNVADAVRWVLGEQRAGALRSGKMDEVIFQGTTRRRPLNFAEVALLFGNEQGRVPIPQSEIEVARKVFREGGSEYSLNRTACRLRDIQNLLRDTGLGTNAYSIIEAGMIETLLSDRAEERRILFEEAAGVGKYKDSRQAATRRLDAAEADLARLNDLIAEVESKVRSLARQRRKAQQHRELQARRLDLEIALARGELEELGATLVAGERRRAELEGDKSAACLQRSAVEALLETRRAEMAALGQERVAVTARLDVVRERLGAREREILLADERRSHAEMRVAQLVRERSETERRLVSLVAEIERVASEVEQARQVLEGCRGHRAARGEQNNALRGTLAAQRAAAEGVATKARTLARDLAAVEGKRAAAEHRQRESAERLVRLQQQDAELDAELNRLTTRAELWSGQTEELQNRGAAADEAVEEARERIRLLSKRESAARDALRAAEEQHSRLAAQVAAREALERGYERFSPAVAAVMKARQRFPGVHGPLADFFPAHAETSARTAATEAYLGALLQALVVDDLAVARAVREWFRNEWKGGGSLLLLPLDAPGLRSAPATYPGNGLPESGGAAWAEALLADLVVVEPGDPLAAYDVGRARIGAGGDGVDTRGVVRLTEQGTGEGILARRELLVRLRAERDAAARERNARQGDRHDLAAALLEAEERAGEAEEVRRVLRAELQRLETQTASHQHQLGRLLRDRDDLAQTLASLRAALAEADEQIVAFQHRAAELTRATHSAGVEAATVQARLGELEARWETARDAEAELRVAQARAEADLRDAERRSAAAAQAHASARVRVAANEAEAVELRTSLESLSGTRERAGEELQTLRAARERFTAELSALDARLAESDAEITRATEHAHVARRREAESAEERHRLDLQNADTRSRIERLRERLEAEWGRPWDALVAAATPVTEADSVEWSAELHRIAQQLEGLGPVNMLAVDEHEEEERRLAFLLEQRADLVKARDDLTTAIRQINRTAKEVFLATFATIRENFGRTYQSLFQGGECDIWLADPDDPLESAVEIQASPRGKRTQRIHLLSGGERTLTALALLFALYLVKPSPFCVLDEVDAPLDESNVGRFIQLLHDFKRETQFIVITHNTRTMEAADWIYGVTMEEPGVSSVVGVELQGAWAVGDRVA